MSLRREDVEGAVKSIADMKLIEMQSKELQLLNEIVKSVRLIVGRMGDMDLEDLEARIADIDGSKREIELLKRDFLEYVSKMSPSLYHREDWLRMSTKVYNATDKAIGVLHRLEYIIRRGWSVPDSIRERITSLMDSVSKIINEYNQALRNMANKEYAFEKFRSVDKLEKECDTAYRSTIFAILESNISTPAMLVLLDIAEMLEDISDIVASATDDLRIILLNLV